MPTGSNLGMQQTCNLPLIMKMETHQVCRNQPQGPSGQSALGSKALKKELDFWEVQGQVLLRGCRCFWILLHFPLSIHPEHHPSINEGASCPSRAGPMLAGASARSLQQSPKVSLYTQSPGHHSVRTSSWQVCLEYSSVSLLESLCNLQCLLLKSFLCPKIISKWWLAWPWHNSSSPNKWKGANAQLLAQPQRGSWKRRWLWLQSLAEGCGLNEEPGQRQKHGHRTPGLGISFCLGPGGSLKLLQHSAQSFGYLSPELAASPSLCITRLSLFQERPDAYLITRKDLPGRWSWPLIMLRASLHVLTWASYWS